MYIWIILFISNHNENEYRLRLSNPIDLDCSNHNENEYRLRLSKCYKRTCSGYTLLMVLSIMLNSFLITEKVCMHKEAVY